MKKQNTDFREKKIQKMVRLLKEKAMIDDDKIVYKDEYQIEIKFDKI